jgi:arylsulfatase A-like enzyme
MGRANVSRRSFVLGTSAAGLALAARSGTGRAAVREARRPNIIFILADDLGYADLSCYGAPTIRTPAIDRLAGEGVRLTQGYANSAVCSATRTALITGRYQDRLAIGLEEPLGNNRGVGLPASHPTLPSLLKKVGYETALIGKWHLGYLPDYDPLKSGYDHFYGFRGGALDYFSHGLVGNPDLWDGPTPVSQQGYVTDLFGQRAVDLVRGRAVDAKPLFLSLHFNAPHWPWESPADEAESKRVASRSNPFDWDGGTIATYNRMVESMDRQIGRMLDALDESGQADNSIVIFTSDNGGERFSNTWPFSGKKTELLEGGLRVPAVIRWPGHLPAGMVNQQVAVSMDWLPTLLSAAGTAPDPAFPSDGINLLPRLAVGSPPVSRTLYWRYKANAQRAVRDGDFKALKIAGNTYLFNVVDDPLERANLKERMPDVYQRLTREWDTWNKTMLPERAETNTDNFTAEKMADHINTPAIDAKAVDAGNPWP